MPEIPVDLGEPLEVELFFESPHVVTYWLWSRTGASGWLLLGSGTDEETVTTTRHIHTVEALGAPSQLRYRVILAGNPQTPYRAAIQVRQNGATLFDETLTGMTDGRGAAVEQDGLEMVAAEEVE